MILKILINSTLFIIERIIYITLFRIKKATQNIIFQVAFYLFS